VATEEDEDMSDALDAMADEVTEEMLELTADSEADIDSLLDRVLDAIEELDELVVKTMLGVLEVLASTVLVADEARVEDARPDDDDSASHFPNAAVLSILCRRKCTA
jgi:hypothetical protein